MRLRANATVERAGVDAAQTFFDAERCVFQPVALENDYGKDAYVDRGEDGEVSGFCVAVQIKSGRSYKRANGYAIPVEGHERVWREATLPVAGIVHDPEDGSLYWVNITAHLSERPQEQVEVIPVPKANRLLSDTLRARFWPSMQASAGLGGAGRAILSLASEDPDIQQAALLDCFGAGRSDTRVLLLLRRFIGALEGDSLRLAIHLLSLATGHPDVYWSRANWIPQPARQTLARSFRWGDDEVLRLLGSAEYDDWRRGRPGQDAFQLLEADPDVSSKIARVLPRAFDIGDDDLGATALAVALHLAGDEAPATYEALARRDGRVRQLGAAADVERHLAEWGQINLWG